MDSFIKTVDAIFSLIRYAQELSYKEGYDERADEERGRPGEINLPKEQRCDDIAMSKKEFCELLESDVKETEFKIILEISKIVQRGYRNGKYQED